MLVYRLLQAAFGHEPLSGQGAALYGGRWNPKGISLLYTTESPALSLLEVLVHLNPKRIPQYYLATIEVPDSIRVIQDQELPADWRATGSGPLPSQVFLVEWLQKPDYLVIQVPSTMVPVMANYLINPRHPLFSSCQLLKVEVLDCYVWPIANATSVNQRRKQAGFDQSVEENAKRLEHVGELSLAKV